MAQLPAVAVSLIVTGALTAAQVGLAYLMREKGNSTPIDQGKLDDLRITGSEYGTIIPRVWGTARMGANVIWAAPIRHSVISTPSTSGKGGPTIPGTNTHIYKSDFGLQICRGEMDGVRKIWADADVLNDDPPWIVSYEAEDATIVAPAEAYNDLTASNGQAVRKIGFQSATSTVGRLNFATAHSSAPKNSELDTTAQTSIQISYKCTGNKTISLKVMSATVGVAALYDSTFTFPDTGGQWKIAQLMLRDSGVGGNDGYHADIIEFAKTSDSGEGPDIDKITVGKLWTPVNEEVPVPVTGAIDPYAIEADPLESGGAYSYIPSADANGAFRREAMWGTMTFYPGSTTQVVDPRLEAYLDTRYGTSVGITYAPAHRETAMAVFEDFDMNGGRIPNFTFEVYNVRNNMSHVLGDLFADVGLSATDYNLATAADYEFIGVIDSQKQSRKAFIENLGRYFGFRLAEFNGIIQLVNSHTFTSVGSVDDELLRARMSGEEVPGYDAEVLVSPTSELPQMIRFNISNPKLDYHNETVQAFVQADVYSSDTLDLNFPVVDLPENARQNAEFMLLKAYTETKSVTFNAMPEMLRYSIGDVVTVTLNAIETKIRIEKLTAGLPIGIVTVEGFILEEYDPTEIVTQVQEENSFAYDQQSFALFPRASKAIPIISRPIRQLDRLRLGCYVAVTPVGEGVSQNIALYLERGTGDYQLLNIYDQPSTCGVVDGTMASHTNPTVKDTVTDLYVYFYNNADLQTVTEAELNRYPELNLLRVGNEWVQFQTATKQNLPAGSAYRSYWKLENFFRGRFGTETAMSGHAASENVVVFDQTVRFYDLTEQDVGETVNFKTTTGGRDLDDITANGFTFTPISRYEVSNDLTERKFDADATSLNEVSDVMSTLIKDLKI